MNNRYVNIYYNAGTNELVSGEHSYETKDKAVANRRESAGISWVNVIKMIIKE